MGFMRSLIPILAHCAGLNFIDRVNFRQKRPAELAFNLFLKHWELSGLMTFWSHVPYSEVFFVCLVGWITITRWLALPLGVLVPVPLQWNSFYFHCHKISEILWSFTVTWSMNRILLCWSRRLRSKQDLMFFDARMRLRHSSPVLERFCLSPVEV